MISHFPDFSPIGLEHRDSLDAYLRAHSPLASEFTFTNLFAWREVCGYQVARYREGWLFRRQIEGRVSLLQPLVVDDPAGAARECLHYLKAHSPEPLLERVGEDFIAQLGTGAEEFGIEEDRDNFDYIYAVNELIELSGARYHDKKNLLNQFTKYNNYRYEPLTPELISTCKDFAHDWCVEKRCEQDAGMTHENCAGMQMLHHFHSLSMTGGVLLIDEQLKAFTLGEPLNADTVVIHVEKAAPGYTGICQAINWEFLRHAAAEFTYVNREQDMGVPGLRKAKMSYNPVRLVKKYTIR